jgi:hypothetical protein
VAKSQQERQAEKRKAQLDDLEDQVRNGTLTVRQMTPQEKRKYGPPRERPSRGRSSRS